MVVVPRFPGGISFFGRADLPDAPDAHPMPSATSSATPIPRTRFVIISPEANRSPLYLPLIEVAILLTRLYYARRFGMSYPSLRGVCPPYFGSCALISA